MGKLIGNDLWIEINFGEYSIDDNGAIHKNPQFKKIVYINDFPDGLNGLRIREGINSTARHLQKMARDIERYKALGVDRVIA